ncbi:hypothetical protein FEM48_Zijuj04G0118700 [Ziziphus jujuba var. spinosa]|uniref:O-acyltransferase WSD1 C-terminal domain-containing protein n=1 Tax=Ziziphus jujuba var. spinosa TaxID=714518 RepID=A0A978VJQ5_ZIZJJ|nr:hypothetical protein FEM48_Zijuj04G0118700 [Ziziphus jujuba var. spinosa]
MLLNTRMMDHASINEMMKPDSKTPWGNRFAFLHIPIPKFRNDQFSNPLDIVQYAQKVIGRKRKSLSVYLNGRLLEMVKKFKGYEDLDINIVSYMGKLSVTFGTKEGHMDLQKFKSCMEQAFDTIFKAAQNE